MNGFVQSSPFFGIVLGWELPEDLFDILAEDWISEFKDVHGHQENVDEVEEERLNLLLVNSNTEHVTQHEVVPENAKVEEDGHGVSRNIVVSIANWIVSH